MLHSGTNPPIERQLDVDRIPQLAIAVSGVLSVTLMLYIFGDALPARIAVTLLGVLAALGSFFVIGLAFGICRVGGRRTGSEIATALFDSMPEGVIVLSNDGEIVFANEQYMAALGATSSADIAPPDQVLRVDSQGAAALLRLAAAADRGEAAMEEVRLSEHVGEARWLRLEVRPIRFARSELYTAWLVEDVSADRAAQETTFAQARDAIDYLDRAPVGLFASRTDGVISHINATLADWLDVDLTAFQRQELRFSEFLTVGGHAAFMEALNGDRSSTVLDLDLASNSGESVPARVTIGHAADGEQRLVAVSDRRAERHDTLVGIVSGEGVSGSSDHRFEQFFNHAPVAIVSVNGDGEIQRSNAPFVRMFADVAKDVSFAVGTPIVSMLPEQEERRFENALQAALQGRTDVPAIDFVVPGAMPDEERYFRLLVNATANASVDSGEVAIVYAIENTEQKAIESAYVQAQKMQAVGTLAGGMAHDFNNSLTAINLSADLLLESHAADDPSHPEIHNIKNTVMKAAALVRQLMAYARKQTMLPEVLELTDVLADFKTILERLAGTGVNVEMQLGHDLWAVRADVVQLQQVISNLVANARDAMNGDGAITITTRNVDEAEARDMSYRDLQPADYVMVEVSDTGSGMAPEVLAKIFEPFYTTKGVGKGTGLGLSMVYGIVKQSGGFIFADSEVGSGTRFRIFLPRCERPAPVARETNEAVSKLAQSAGAGLPAAVSDLTGSEKLLLVEDETSVRLSSVRALSMRGYDVHDAADGVEALEILEEEDGAFDIIVSDVVMPEMDGPTLLREVRERYGDTIKFVFVSGYAEDAFAKNLPENAQFSFLPKPYTVPGLAAKVKAVLAGS